MSPLVETISRAALGTAGARNTRLALAAFLALAAAACDRDPSFTPRTTAPPGAVADYFENRSNDGRSIRLTEGVALAVECADAKGRPCSFDGTVIDDPKIATVRRAYGDIDQKLVYGPTPTQSSYRTRTLFVVTAKQVGRTTMTVRTGYGDVPIFVEVVPAKS